MVTIGVEDIKAAVTSRRAQYMDDLRALSSIDCPTSYKDGVDSVARIVGHRLEAVGAQVETIANRDAGIDIIGRFKGPGSKRVLFLCHMDTVYPVGTVAQRPYVIEAGRILAPGVCDMKAGLLSAIYAVAALLDTGYQDFQELTVLCNSDEESAPRHSIGTIRREAADASCVFCMEAARANGDIVSSRKGVAVFEVDSHGRESHAGVSPEQGRNAIVALADRLVEVWKLNGLKDGLTLSPGLIGGGSAVNTVPGNAHCSIDVRVRTSGDLDFITGRLQEVFTQSVIPEVSFTVRNMHTMPPLEEDGIFRSLGAVGPSCSR